MDNGVEIDMIPLYPLTKKNSFSFENNFYLILEPYISLLKATYKNYFIPLHAYLYIAQTLATCITLCVAPCITPRDNTFINQTITPTIRLTIDCHAD